MKRAAWTIAILLSQLQLAAAQSYYCDRPRKPSIPYSPNRFEMESAQNDIERYTRRMKEYVDCLADERNDAVDEHRRVVREWNDALSSYSLRK